MENTKLSNLFYLAVFFFSACGSPVTPAVTFTNAASQQTDAQNRITPPETSDLTLAYTHDGDLWLWGEADGPVQLNAAGNANRVFFSPDGSLIAYTRLENGVETEIWVIGRDGSHDHALLTGEQLSAMAEPDSPHGAAILGQIVWQPNSQELVFGTYQISQETYPRSTLMHFVGPINFANSSIYVDNGVHRILFPPGQGGRLHYSPDASQVAVVTPDLIRVFDAAGAQEKLSFSYDTNNNIFSAYQDRVFALPLWNQSGTSLGVSTIHYPDYSDYIEETPEPITSEIWYLSLDSKPTQNERIFEGFFTSYMSIPLISANLTSVLYTLLHQGTGDLHLMDIDGRNDQLIASGPLLSVIAWSPDSQSFVFTLTDVETEYKLGKLGQSGYTDLSEVQNIAAFRWIDSQRFVFTTLPIDGQPAQLRLGLVDGLSILLTEWSGGALGQLDFYIGPP
ncbi:MAG: hypothetical protein OEZ02_01805 [Anaerolineae bacterium]|nr:hypothetical protein [Anaerolineae bacterium]